jgi:hypothetical protein
MWYINGMEDWELMTSFKHKCRSISTTAPTEDLAFEAFSYYTLGSLRVVTTIKTSNGDGTTCSWTSGDAYRCRNRPGEATNAWWQTIIASKLTDENPRHGSLGSQTTPRSSWQLQIATTHFQLVTQLLQGTILALKKATPDIAEPGLQGRKQTPEDTLSVRYTHTTGTSLVSHWTHKRILQAGPKPETRSLKTLHR